MNKFDQAFVKKVAEVNYGVDYKDHQSDLIREIFIKRGVDGLVNGLLDSLITAENIPRNGTAFNDDFMDLMADYGGYIYNHSKEAYYTLAFFAMNRVRRTLSIKAYPAVVLQKTMRKWAEDMLSAYDGYIRTGCTWCCWNFFTKNIERCLKDPRLKPMAESTIFNMLDDFCWFNCFSESRRQFLQTFIRSNYMEDDMYKLVDQNNWRNYRNFLRYYVRGTRKEQTQKLCKKLGYSGWRNRQKRREIKAMFYA